MVVQIERDADGSIIAAKTETVIDAPTSVDDNPTALVPDTNCDDSGTTLASGTTATTTTHVLITDDGVSCDSGLVVIITPP